MVSPLPVNVTQLAGPRTAHIHIQMYTDTVLSLTHGHTGQLPGGPMLNLCMLCMAFFLCVNTDFVGSTNIINICVFNFIHI
jgi:hypothetical protein